MAVRSDVRVSDLLRRCALLGAELNNEELKTWAFLELRGYSGGLPVPDYRVLPSHAIGNFAGAFGSEVRGFSIPASLMPKELRGYAERVTLRNPIAEIEGHAYAVHDKNYLAVPWPGDLIRLMQDKVFADMALYSASQSVSKASLTGVIDAVRNRILEFVMRIEEATPQAAPGAEAPAIPNERVQHLVQTIINGNVTGDVIAGVSGSVTQVKVGDLQSLKLAVQALGVSGADVKEMEKAILEDEKTIHGMGAKTAHWLSTIGQKAASGALKLAQGVGIGVISKAILHYFGLG
jgi:hypothetical protein